MARVPFTLRLDEQVRAALEDLSKIEGRPVNQLLNEAVRNFLIRRGPRERNLEANLARLQAYRKRDPGYRAALDAFANAEATLDDPLEGKPVQTQFVNGRTETAGPVQNRIRRLLSAQR